MISSIPSELSLSGPLLVSEVTYAGMGTTSVWEVIATVADVAVMAVVVKLVGVIDQGTRGRFLHRGGGVL